MNSYRYILGLDLGVGSVGWACMAVNDENQPIRVIDLGSRIFEAEPASMEDRRIARGTRRVIRRRKSRVKRVKSLFHRHNYLTKDDIDNFYNSKGIQLADPYETKLKGKENALTYSELLIILVHYAKSRGFKSNRKAIEKEVKLSKTSNDEQKLLYAKKVSEDAILEEKKQNPDFTITDMLLSDFVQYGKIRNTSGNYIHGITREMIEEEMKLILSKQMELGILSEAFVNELLEIVLFQRSFMDGPDHGPYSKPLERMIGICGFTQESRAAKSCVSNELFILVQKLNDLTFQYEGSKEIQHLTGENILRLVDKALNHNDITYNLVREEIGSLVSFPRLQVSKNDYLKIVETIKNDSTKTIRDEMDAAKGKISIFKLKNYVNLRNSLKRILGKFPDLSLQQYDLIAECFSRNKSDLEIKSFLEGNRIILMDVSLPKEVVDAIFLIDDKDYKEFGKLSLSFIYQVLPLMIKGGLNYYKAAEICGYDITKKKINESEFDIIPVINDILKQLDKSINNKGVLRTLVESRKIVNSVIHTYGKPIRIHIEMARELTKSEDEKQELMYQQQERAYANESLKFQIYSKFPDRFRSVQNVSSNDLVQYKLYIEQGGICPYSLAMTGDEHQSRINERDLFTSMVEIDHIVPYSIGYDDRYVNKTLVKEKYNQEKGNQLPSQAFQGSSGFNKYCSWINSQSRISLEKRSRYLAKIVDDKLLNDYRARTINDTRYAIKSFKEILEYSFPTILVKPFTGQITAKLRGVWLLNNLTHSYQSKNYVKTKTTSEELKLAYQKLSDLVITGVNTKSKDFKYALKLVNAVIRKEEIKNRDNHLHHAMDAAIIACATDEIRRSVEIHEIFLRTKKRYQDKVEIRLPVYDENGEVQGFETSILDFEKYLTNIDERRMASQKKFPLPYENFRQEIIIRTYEMDENRLQMELFELTGYNNVDVKTIKPLFVSHHYSSKLSGRLHKATFYGLKEDSNGKIMTSRVAINSETFDAKKLERIYDKEATQSYIYNAVKEWMNGYKNGRDAYLAKKHPCNKNGNEIKKVKLNEGNIKEEFSIKQDVVQYVEKENVVQVHIYQRQNDDKLYFVGMDRFRLYNYEKRDDLDLVLWFGQAKSNIVINKNDLAQSGFIKKPQIIMKGQTILVELKSGVKCLCKLVGCTSGQIEVASILGDNYDLISNGLFMDHIVRYKITVSTIKLIKPISVNAMGKIMSNVL